MPTAPATKSPALAIVKTAVIAMGVLIFVGVVVLVYGLVSRGATTLSTTAPADPAKAAIMRLGLPAETQVKSMAVSDRTLSLHLAIPGQGEWIYIVPLSGEGRLLKIAIGAGETKP